MGRSLAALAAFAALLTGSIASAGAAGGAGTPTGGLQVAILVPGGGDFAQQNALIANGAQVAADESGSAKSPIGTQKLTLVQVPLRGDANPAQVMGALVKRGIKVVVLPCDVDSVPALAKAGSQADELMLLPCDPDRNVASSTPRVWPTGMAGNEEVAQMVNYAESLNGTTGYILSAKGSGYIATMDRYFREAAKLDGVKILGESTVAMNGKNTAAVASAIKKVNPRVIFTALFSPYAEPILAGLRSHGVVIPPVFVTDGMDADENLDRYGNVLQNVNVASFGFPRPTSEQFLRDYQSAFGHQPSGSFPGLGYETLQILDTAVAKAGSTDTTAINDAFSKGFTVTGVALGDVQYLGHGQQIPRTNSALARIVRGEHYALFSSDATQSTRVPAP
jgi:ABC-type branched-subunit amino acid transport system substrate-binding protein